MCCRLTTKVDYKFTEFSLWIADYIEDRSLLNIPENYWKQFTLLVYFHFILGGFLFIYGILCFGLGMQYSVFYTEVNCSDGIAIWMPMVNMISSISGLFSLRVVHLHWPPLIHFVMLWLSIPFMITTAFDSAFAASRWFRHAKERYSDTLKEEQSEFTYWADTYANMDIFFTIFAIINVLVVILLLVYYIKYWYRTPQSTQ